MTPEQAQAQIAETVERWGPGDTLAADVDATIARRDDLRPASTSGLPAIAVEASAASSGLDAVAPAIDGADFVARGVLGRGGMGVVRLAEQRSLRREVAVKTSGRADVAAVRALVREARITGGLEHPNVVPSTRSASTQRARRCS